MFRIAFCWSKSDRRRELARADPLELERKIK
jgi:hypothetical protein